MTRQLAYCTNVHAGANLKQMAANLEQHSLLVKQRFTPEAAMGVGLWLAAPAARQLRESSELPALRTWLVDRGLVPFTLNGFPYGDFHEPVVKHRVYQPSWLEESRVQYTLDLIEILDGLLPAGMEGSISTLPLAWRDPPPDPQQWDQLARNLVRIAERLSDLEEQTGRLIHVCLEPEPGCLLQRGGDVVTFFRERLWPAGNQEQLQRYVRVCHDVCHTAVMFESQRDVLDEYARHNIRVGKVQVSSAVCIDFDAIPATEREVALQELASFAEDRYLHQTMIREADAGPPQLHDDLPAPLHHALQDARHRRGQWRVHFHVPIYLRQFGAIGTTQDEIPNCLQAINTHGDVTHFEVETYAWGVLPEHLQQPQLADGIAREMQWLADLPEFAQRGPQ